MPTPQSRWRLEQLCAIGAVEESEDIVGLEVVG